MFARRNEPGRMAGGLERRLSGLDTSKLDVTLSTRASQQSVDLLTNTLSVQEQLHVQVVEVQQNRRYPVFVTRRGAPVEGASLQQLTAISVEQGKRGVASTIAPATTEVAPGLLDVTVTQPTAVQALGSTLWAMHQDAD